MIERLRRISYFLAYAIATIPLFHYIRDGRILALMVAVVTFAYVMVVLSSVRIAQPILSSEKSKTVLPRWLPDKAKYHKWWMLVRRTLKWHLLLVIPKVGLALGFAQWLHLGTDVMLSDGILRTFVYGSSDVGMLYPDWETIILAGIFLSLFITCEVSLISGLLLIVSHPIKLFMLRVIISLSIIGITCQFQTCFAWNHIDRFCKFENTILSFANQVRVWETIETGLLTVSGFDFLHSANSMKLYSRYDDNRPFVARQIVAGVLGLVLYAGATWLNLWFVEDEVQS